MPAAFRSYDDSGDERDERARPKVSRCGVVIGGTSRGEVEGSTDRSRRHKEYAPDCHLSMGQRAAKSPRVKGPPQRRAVRYWKLGIPVGFWRQRSKVDSQLSCKGVGCPSKRVRSSPRWRSRASPISSPIDAAVLAEAHVLGREDRGAKSDGHLGQVYRADVLPGVGARARQQLGGQRDALDL